MKIASLFLKAFGPFTDTTLDFSGPANLHIVYGPNEAGKSSALRAMGDMRYGIHPRSKDDFVHGYSDLLLSASFVDSNGQNVGLARRKGNKDTLTAADVITGCPQPASPISAAVMAALTGGVDREQFQKMYGLNSDHLRSGGQMLLRGEGDLGTALFEASAGTSDIKSMLETLQADAKKFFTPRGQTTILNESGRQLEEARLRYRRALTKPDQWKVLNRAHEDAKASLADTRKQLATTRQKLAELTELRAVEPLLRQLDGTAQEWTEVKDNIALVGDFREQRLAAQQQKAQAEASQSDADEALVECRQAMQSLVIEELLLPNAAAIERIASDQGVVRRERSNKLRLEAASDSESQQLILLAKRFTAAEAESVDLARVFDQTLAETERFEIEDLLEQIQALTLELVHVRSQIKSLDDKLALKRDEHIDIPDPELQRRLARALKSAQAVGEAEKRLDAMVFAIALEQRKVDRSIADLGLATEEQLEASQWLASSEIDDHGRVCAEIQNHVALSADQIKQIETDLETQKRRRKSLAAAGEIVSAETLLQARTLRDQEWHGIRNVFIDGNHSGDVPSKSGAAQLPAKFERSQTEADRQADLLREGAKRAAEISECEHRITEMTDALEVLKRVKAQQIQSQDDLETVWRQRLSSKGIPQGSASLVREWVGLRKFALERHGMLVAARDEHGLLQRQISELQGNLFTVLTEVGACSPNSPASLTELITLGVAVDREWVGAKAAMVRRNSEIGELGQQIQDLDVRQRELVDDQKTIAGAIDQKLHKLFLQPGTSPAIVKSQLQMVRRWTQDYLVYLEHLSQINQIKASEASVLRDAGALGKALSDSNWDNVDMWVDGLTQRLAASREAASLRVTLKANEIAEMRRKSRADSELAAAEKSLATLLEGAELDELRDLPDAEIRSDRRREVSARLEGLKKQLASTSGKATEALRASLATRDSVALDFEKAACVSEIETLQADEMRAINIEQNCRSELALVDTSDEAAYAREEMEAAIARYRAGVRPWAQLKLAEALLTEALRRHREKNQGPVVALAGEYFKVITAGRFISLWVDYDGVEPRLMAKPSNGKLLAIEALSEGTADQLYLALRLAALQVQRQPGRMMPLILDDVLITSDDDRAKNILLALENFAREGQVIVFTHHQHLIHLAEEAVDTHCLKVHHLPAAFKNKD